MEEPKVQCEDCLRRSICKHCETYLDILETVRKAIGKHPKWLSYRLSCKDYKTPPLVKWVYIKDGKLL